MNSVATTERAALPRSPTSATFFDNLDSFAEAPQGVVKLRELILDLAVRGKLVEQDENDEPASELLVHVEEHREGLIADGKLRRPRKETPLRKDELPFRLPHGWEWVKLGRLMRKMGAGSTPLGGKRVYVDDGVMFLRSQNVRNDGLRLDDVARIPPNIHKDMSGTHVESGDVLLNITGASIGRCALVPNSFDHANVSQHVAILRLIDKSLRQFLHLCVVSRFFQETIMRVQVGVSREGLSMTRLREFPFPLPPLSEQRRIVSKVDGLMLLCDELESRGTERVRLRERASRSCLARLVSSRSRRDLASAWQRLSDHFEVRYACPETLPHLCQSILQLAVQGKLVPQDPNDEPADAQIERVANERARLLSAKAIRKTKTPSPFCDSDVTFDAPSGWTWSRFGNTILELRYGTSKKCDYDIEGVPVLRIPNVVKGQIDIDDLKFTTMTDKEFDDLKLSTCDLLMIRSNGSKSLVGRTAVVNRKADGFAYAGYLVRLRTLPDATFPDYLHLALNCLEVREQIERPIRTTSGVKNINSTEIGNLLIPLPPIAEQKRIVAKVDQLLSQCGELSARLRERQCTTRQLLAATIYHVLNRE